MEYIFSAGLAIQLIIGLAARKEIISELTEQKVNASGKILAKSAQFLYRKFFCHFHKKTAGAKIDKYIVCLHPGTDRKRIIIRYYIEKIRVSYALILLGNLLALTVSLYISQNGRVEEARVPKNPWEQGSYQLDLEVAAPGLLDSVRDMAIVVEPVSLSEDEVSALAQEVFTKLPAVILGQNLTLEEVTAPLDLITQLAGYPFTVSWESDNPAQLKTNGGINEQNLPVSGQVVMLTAHLLYQNEWAEYRFSEDIFVNLMPLEAARDEWEEAIAAAVMAKQQEYAFTDFFPLPEEISGALVNWREKKPPDGLYLWLAVMAAAVIAFIGQDQDLRKKAARRDRQIDRDYPDLVRKLALYLGAGMTLRGSWKRVAWDYEAGKKAGSPESKGKEKGGGKVKYLYEEMLFSVREMENGVAEREVYENFGKRIGIPKYRKLSGLLSNHLQKGNKNLLQVLREETELALEDRQKAARAIGEEMSTKLLLPMILMLLIVMIIIMVPAFQMF